LPVDPTVPALFYPAVAASPSFCLSSSFLAAPRAFVGAFGFFTIQSKT
jgi:hypothetical protein